LKTVKKVLEVNATERGVEERSNINGNISGTGNHSGTCTCTRA
jgi:hypothetical protein